ncbi:MAG TPA: NAD(P)-binding domain-containing protein [Gammaproteobacteria bacterium]|nr:NAD(P)-binding domain-containing protein [Gammaproteobacteria bacterium]
MQINQRTQVAIIGAGPTGVELAVALTQAGIPFLLFDAGQIGQTIAWWPKHTRFFSTSERIAIPGLPLTVFDQQHPTNDDYLAYLRGVVQQFGIKVHAYEPVIDVKHLSDGEFMLITEAKGIRQYYQADFVVLATGGMAEPRMLNIPGEDLPHVSHYLNDPHDYFQQELLVVGGRNSAVEYALRCWRAGAKVTLSYHKPELPKTSIKPALLQDIETVVREGKICFLPGTVPMEITMQEVLLAATDELGNPLTGEVTYLPFDFVLLCTGYQADTTLFRQLGVDLLDAEQSPRYDPETMESNVPGVFVLGTAAGGTQSKFMHFIETSHAHVPKILTTIQQRLAGSGDVIR